MWWKNKDNKKSKTKPCKLCRRRLTQILGFWLCNKCDKEGTYMSERLIVVEDPHEDEENSG